MHALNLHKHFTHSLHTKPSLSMVFVRFLNFFYCRFDDYQFIHLKVDTTEIVLQN